jgi:hypothetical protein
VSKKNDRKTKAAAQAAQAAIAAQQTTDNGAVQQEAAPKQPVVRRIKGTVVSRFAEYERTTTATGNKSYDSADALAVRLRGLELDEVYKEAAAALQVSVVVLKARYAKLNPGMQRMNLGNRMRGAAHKAATQATVQ